MGPRKLISGTIISGSNVCKSTVMVFSRYPVECEWKWGEHALPRISNCTYLGIDFACNGAWDMHIQKVHDYCKKKVISYIV